MADAYGTKVQAAVPTTVAQIGGAVPGGKAWINARWTIVNTTQGRITVQLFANGTDAAHAITGVMAVDGNGHLECDQLDSFAAAEYIAGVASAAGLYFRLSADEVG